MVAREGSLQLSCYNKNAAEVLFGDANFTGLNPCSVILQGARHLIQGTPFFSTLLDNLAELKEFVETSHNMRGLVPGVGVGI